MILNKSINDIFFSFIVCCYNSEKYLKETIDSIINQTHKNWEIVIVNDGKSNDGTKEVLEHSSKKYRNITIIDNPKKIVSTGLNLALDLCEGDIIVRMDMHTTYNITSLIYGY